MDKEMEGALDDVAKQLDKQVLEEKDKDDDDEGKYHFILSFDFQREPSPGLRLNKPTEPRGLHLCVSCMCGFVWLLLQLSCQASINKCITPPPRITALLKLLVFKDPVTAGKC